MDHFGIMDSAGNMLDWFEDSTRAEEAFSALVAEDQSIELALLSFDQDGRPVEAMRLTHGMVTINESPWLVAGGQFHQPLAPGAREQDRLITLS
ncbi:MAG: hypothetical protein ACRDL0_17845 [Thermoleophilaceae bacterium]